MFWFLDLNGLYLNLKALSHFRIMKKWREKSEKGKSENEDRTLSQTSFGYKTDVIIHETRMEIEIIDLVLKSYPQLEKGEIEGKVKIKSVRYVKRTLFRKLMK
jgi:hypothetical protein